MSEKKSGGFFSRLTRKKDKKERNAVTPTKNISTEASKLPSKTPDSTPPQSNATAQPYFYSTNNWSSPSSSSPKPPKHKVNYSARGPPLPLPPKVPGVALPQTTEKEILTDRVPSPYSYSYKPTSPEAQYQKPNSTYSSGTNSTSSSSVPAPLPKHSSVTHNTTPANPMRPEVVRLSAYKNNSANATDTLAPTYDRPSKANPTIFTGGDTANTSSRKIVEHSDTNQAGQQGVSQTTTLTPIPTTNAKLLHDDPPRFSDTYVFSAYDGRPRHTAVTEEVDHSNARHIAIQDDTTAPGHVKDHANPPAPTSKPINDPSLQSSVPRPPAQDTATHENLEKRLEKLKRTIRKKNRGALEIFEIERTTSRIDYSIFIDGSLPDMAFPLRGLTDSLVHDHPSFKLITADLALPVQLPNHPDYDTWIYVDEEFCDNYLGILPGTLSHKGICKILTSSLNPQLFQTDVDTGKYPLPGIALKTIMEVLNHRNKVGISASDVENYMELQKLIGDWATMESITPEMYTLDKQCEAIIKILRNPTYTYNHFNNRSVSRLVHMKYQNAVTIAYQCLLALELMLRLPHASPSALTGLNAEVQAELMISKRWIDNIEVYWRPNDDYNYFFKSKIHAQQIDGIIKFAEEIRWPYRDIAEKNLREAWEFAQSGAVLDDHVWDWIHGACLPGKYYSIKAMSVLMALSPPNIKELGTAPYTNAGLMLTDRTYWRAPTVLGAVLGGMKGVKSCLHWIGPCVPVIEGVEFVAQWLSVTTRFIIAPEVTDPDIKSSALLPYDMNNLAPKDFEARLRRMELSDNWVNPHPPPPKLPENGGDKIEVQGIKLEKYSVANATSAIQESNAFYASLLIRLNGNLITYNLTYNPLFTCSHPCIGSHERHKSQIKYTIVEAAALQNSPRFDHILVVNVQGSSEADVMARAWCAQQGRNALVKIPQTCFCCAWDLARSINVHVIIYQ
ncbi:unnamed protein product [Umbelopsis ramanniana]